MASLTVEAPPLNLVQSSLAIADPLPVTAAAFPNEALVSLGRIHPDPVFLLVVFLVLKRLQNVNGASCSQEPYSQNGHTVTDCHFSSFPRSQSASLDIYVIIFLLLT